MSNHEHQMVSDHPIPPYAWHYKCSVGGCDYGTDSSQVPVTSQAAMESEKDAEIARLQAEVERLSSNPTWAEVEGLRRVVDRLERQRDQAEAVVRAVEQELAAVKRRWPNARLDGTTIAKTVAAYRERA